MGRRRKAWLTNKTGIRTVKGARTPGYYAEWHDYSAGKPVHRSKCFETQKAARQFVRRFNAEQDLRLIGEVIPRSVQEAGAEFLRGCQTLAHDTRIHYESAIGMLAGHLPAGRMLCDVDGGDIDSFVAWRLRCSQAPTVAKHVRSLRRFFNWALKRGYLERNPLDLATALPGDKHSRNRPVITEGQLVQLYTAIDTEDRRVAYLLALTTGLDRGVIEGLLPTQIDLADGLLRIRRIKTDKNLVVPLHPSIQPWLARRLAACDPQRPLLRGLSRQQNAKDWWKRATQAAGVPGLLFRDLRAVAAARLQRVPGMTLAHAQRLLGHASIETTARHYTMPEPTLLQAFGQLALPGAPPSEAPHTD